MVVAGMLAGANHAYNLARQDQSVELVWTGPSSELVATRKTEQALIEVISRAQHELFLVSFVVYKANSVVEALRKASDRGVAVSILLEPGEQHGGQVSVDSMRMIRESVQDAQIYTWSRKEGPFVGGKVHAKLAIADNWICFISSANLTGHAMEKNMEAGVLIRRGDLPDRLSKHIKALITIGVIQRIPLGQG
jgi:phosphatidylserine/phosphatidylglycerophosphate/cardiolipin synthase-like enzyme